MEAVSVVGWVGTACGLLLFSSPAPTFLRIARQGNVGSFSATPYVVSLLQCALWCSYAAITPGRLTVLVTNGCGLALQLLWCCVFVRFCRQRRLLVSSILAAAAAWLGTGSLARQWAGRLPPALLESAAGPESAALGLACGLLNVLMYASPLAAARQVVRTGSVESMPLPLSLMTFLTSACWAAFGALAHDPWVLVPNACGVVLGAAQLAIYAAYSRGRSPGNGPSDRKAVPELDYALVASRARA